MKADQISQYIYLLQFLIWILHNLALYSHFWQRWHQCENLLLYTGTTIWWWLLLYSSSEGWRLNPDFTILSDMMFKEKINILFCIYHRLLFHKDMEGPSYTVAPLILIKHYWNEGNRIKWDKAEITHKWKERTESLWKRKFQYATQHSKGKK